MVKMVTSVMHIVPHLEKYCMINSYKTSVAYTHTHIHTMQEAWPPVMSRTDFRISMMNSLAICG